MTHQVSSTGEKVWGDLLEGGRGQVTPHLPRAEVMLGVEMAKRSVGCVWGRGERGRGQGVGEEREEEVLLL